jgi:hypothetical protein
MYVATYFSVLESTVGTRDYYEVRNAPRISSGMYPQYNVDTDGSHIAREPFSKRCRVTPTTGMYVDNFFHVLICNVDTRDHCDVMLIHVTTVKYEQLLCDFLDGFP